VVVLLQALGCAGRSPWVAEASALELGEYIALTAQLVSLRVEDPATAWEKNEDGTPNARKPCKRLMAEPLSELRDRVSVLAASRGKKNGAPLPPAAPAPGAGPTSLTEREAAMCKRMKIDPAAYAEKKAAIAARSGRSPATEN